MRRLFGQWHVSRATVPTMISRILRPALARVWHLPAEPLIVDHSVEQTDLPSAMTSDSTRTPRCVAPGSNIQVEWAWVASRQSSEKHLEVFSMHGGDWGGASYFHVLSLVYMCSCASPHRLPTLLLRPRAGLCLGHGCSCLLKKEKRKKTYRNSSRALQLKNTQAVRPERLDAAWFIAGEERRKVAEGTASCHCRHLTLTPWNKSQQCQQTDTKRTEKTMRLSLRAERDAV